MKRRKWKEHLPLGGATVALAGSLFMLGACDDVRMQTTAVNQYYFEQPARVWEETLPLGNGRIGLMPDGGILSENLVMNEISLWSGSKQDADNPMASYSLPMIRK